ncbi:MAG: phosphoribosyl-AMP cyclohydrolase [Hyphomicrobium sp.]
MSDDPSLAFAARTDAQTIEQGHAFQPKFDADGLIGVVVTDSASGTVVMFAHMTAEALRLTIDTGVAHFWSRSRGRLWKKGEESGNMLKVIEIRADCDQDALWLIADIAGDGVACHTGRLSCFYRRIEPRPGAAGGVGLAFVAPPKRHP